MATLVFSAVGQAIGGPTGSQIGALIGQQVDRELFKPPPREGRRLNELAVTTSSYGQPIARQFGTMRVGGSIIWSTDLIEAQANEGAKGQPSTIAYTYSVSFAVALSSTPLSSIGRIWADGKLLRGAAGDLKTGGELRFYPGHGDDSVDPLIAADVGASAPAFRDCAYVVFEHLQLTDFGNRIPTLSFEISALDNDAVGLAELVPASAPETVPTALPYLKGFADEGGPISQSLSTLGLAFPLVCTTKNDGLHLVQADQLMTAPVTLPEPLIVSDAEDGERRSVQRSGGRDPLPWGIRYYDDARDFQPGVQRAVGTRPRGRDRILNLPAVLAADGARRIVNETAQRDRWATETRRWTIRELDPAIAPGAVVRLPNIPGYWQISQWDWFESGVELQLERVTYPIDHSVTSDAGESLEKLDTIMDATHLTVFELPAFGTSRISSPQAFAAATSSNSAWRGAELFMELGSSLDPIGNAGPTRAISGELLDSLEASTSMVFEPQSSMRVQLVGHDQVFESSSIDGLAMGANRLLVGQEILQFGTAVSLGNGIWELKGLLRGRAGTEFAAQLGHPSGAAIALIDHRLTQLTLPSTVNAAYSRIAAIGLADAEPVFADFQNPGFSLRPLPPVHSLYWETQAGGFACRWTRRARGQWEWSDGVDVPLVEEQELYTLGYGSTEDPLIEWHVAVTTFELSATERADLIAEHGALDLWVKQVGTFAPSMATKIASFSQ